MLAIDTMVEANHECATTLPSTRCALRFHSLEQSDSG
jgi:hypothetical protein